MKQDLASYCFIRQKAPATRGDWLISGTHSSCFRSIPSIIYEAGFMSDTRRPTPNARGSVNKSHHIILDKTSD
eukprot:scaffold78937_cov120-Cyclotella_meneghiniana.AAC.2